MSPSLAMASSICIFACPILYYKQNPHTKTANVITLRKPFYSSQRVSVSVATAKPVTAEPIVRRSGNYSSSLWSYDYIESLTSRYTGANYEAESHRLKKAVRMMIQNESKLESPLSTLELVDDLQRLGIAYHFENEISNELEMIYYNYYKNEEKWNKMDLNLKSLGFRLLRQHGYYVPQEIFSDIKDGKGNFKTCIYKDVEAILNLYEASYHALEDEKILDEIRVFTTEHLKENLRKNNIGDKNTTVLVTHSLELPLHYRVPRVEARWFMEVYEQRSNKNPISIELAKLDFNMVQAIHQEDLKQTSRWWKSTSWDRKLSFVRDRLVEHFMWAMGTNDLPQFRTGRTALTKVLAIITTIDDIFDVYGTLEELEKFTDVTTRWDINAIEELPDYMKICFLGFYNSINEISYDALTNEGFHIIPYIKKAWADLCKAYLLEAQWYHNGYKPTLNEYLNNAYVSISAPLVLTHTYFFTSSNIADEALQCLENADSIIRYSALILRLANDLGTTSDELARGDNIKSIQCYMHENDATEEEARAYIKTLIDETWKKLNKERLVANSPFSRAFMECATNLGRTAQFFYHNGDGHGRADLSKPHISSLFINPMQV